MKRQRKAIPIFSVLIVDDHKHLVESMAITIPWERYGVSRVFQAFSGPEALETIAGQAVDILITDIRMPVMSGLELIERVRASGHDIDCILLTGHSDFQYAKRAMELQAINYLVKPVRDEELLRTIGGITAKRLERLDRQAELERLRDAARDQIPRLKADLLAAKAQAELSVHEERERIAEDIHDIVGHTLTATLFQIEAARKLLVRNDAEGLTRLEQSQQLVRKSLQDIREAVGMLKHPDEDADLESVLRRFAAEAERMAGISVHCSIGLDWPVADTAIIKIVCHALQEGITNGIRHGKAATFAFGLHEEAGVLFGSLRSAGIPYGGQALGFGLRAMQERMRRLGGSLSLAAVRDPDGTLLSFRVPLTDVPDGATT
ncbi:response regulator [Paenibacillus hemerocallicola]|uniref:histidine kinase n=1 Tax=Paenibacillus hemerocallicola TaxID=1172614 RepID=A0A5C4T4E6_9BACL|nr:response regulator [Paenibacillus hemerocallicola]TNJ63177.1 response regulator [Paenibacillus hemerocallicola]